MKDFNVRLTVRNNHILRRVQKRYGTVAEMCRQCDLPYTTVSAILTMRRSPLTKSGELSKTAEKLCAALNAMPSDLWPREMAKMTVKKPSYEIELSIAEAKAIASGPDESFVNRQLLEQWAEALTDRQFKAVQLFADGCTYDEIGEKIGGVTRERARQILFQSFRRMKGRAMRQGIKNYSDIAGS